MQINNDNCSISNNSETYSLKCEYEIESVSESISDYEFDYDFNSSVWESDDESECESVKETESKKSTKNLKKENEEKEIKNQTECSICYDDIGCVNCVVTECGHNFHTSCLFKSFTSSTDGCPLCRKELVENTEDDEDSDDESNEDDDESEVDYNIIYDEENDAKVSCNQVADKLTKMGYTMADLINYFVGLDVMEKDKQKYTIAFKEKIQNSVLGILEGDIAVDYRDERSYAEVLRANTNTQTSN